MASRCALRAAACLAASGAKRRTSAASSASAEWWTSRASEAGATSLSRSAQHLRVQRLPPCGRERALYRLARKFMPQDERVAIQVEHACDQTLVERRFILHAQRCDDPTLDLPRRDRNRLQEALRLRRAARHPREYRVGDAGGDVSALAGE